MDSFNIFRVLVNIIATEYFQIKLGSGALSGLMLDLELLKII